MKEPCSCCEGIEQITPVSNVNRPGLSALAYRVGTHATFLETMLARLSTHYLETTEDEADPEAERHEHPTPHSHPLHALTTRDSQDASIAFLDAWATVADVLTFYQERVANEGYLRTATERRSVLEIARLIGYQPRPGVASSVHLAYTLDDSKAVTIPAGSRAQSVPGPDELPQSFETAEDIYARAEWNLLQPRLQRPQAMRREDFDVERAIYLKGTATNLKANDPVLIDFGSRIVNGVPGGSRVELFRVLKVEPEQSTDRTKVTLYPWLRLPQNPPVILPPPGPTFEQQVSRLQTFITTHSRAEDFGVTATTQMAQQVLVELENLQSKLEPTIRQGELRDALDAVLPSLREKHRLASANNFTKLEPWIGSIVSELDENLTRLEEGLKGSQDPSPDDEPAPPTTQPSLTHLTQLLEKLEKPSSRQPPNKQQLGTGLKDNLSESSGALPELLATLRPELRSLLYNAWQDVTITEPTPARVYALRTRAAVFGNNAPLEPIPDRSTGRVTRHREWTLFTDAEQQVSEQFRIEMRFTNSAPTYDLTVALLNPDDGTIGTATRPNNSIANGAFTLSLAPSTERVVVTTSNVDAAQNTATFTFDFQERDFRVVVQWNARGQSVTVTGVGNNLVEVERVVQQPQTFGVGGSVTAVGNLFNSAGNAATEQPNRVSLDASYNQILPGGWAVLERPTPLGTSPSPLIITQVTGVTEASRANYGMTAKGTQLQLNAPWIAPVEGGDNFRVIRGTTVFAQSELLELAEELLDPIKDNLCGARIELANLVSGLEPGRWIIVAGERTDIRTESTQRTETAGAAIGRASEIVSGVKATELVMLSGVEQGYDETVSGDKTHTILLLAESLAYCYKLDTVRLYGNVVRATHGETRTEVLGSGDASKAMQSFALSQQPITYISAPTPSGIESTLQVRASDILWHETDSLAGLKPKDHNYITKTDDENKTTIVFGNGREGARLPTGAENVKAKYRTGIGKPGNVKADQISMVITKPLGVKEVINPLAATGGADRESRDEARRNAPLAVMSLDRLVSTQDYEDFARTFAGVGKASATRLSDGRRQVVHLSIAGADDIPISPTSDLLRNLGEALRKYGDPYQPIQIATRFLKVLVASASVRVHPDYLWEHVEPKIRTAVLEHFSFNRRQLGQDVVLSELIGAMQSIEGVLYVDVDTLDAVAENISTTALLELSSQLKLNQRIRVHLAQVDKTALDPSVRLRPAQLALFTPLVPETLNLTELKG